MIDPTAQSALIGLIEVRRYRAIVLRQLGRPADSEAAIASAQALARANQMAVPLVAARLTRTSATTDDVRGNELAADAGLTSSRQDFTQVVPSTRPVAETALLQAGVAAKQGNTARAVELCRIGAGTAARTALGHRPGAAGTLPGILRGRSRPSSRRPTGAAGADVRDGGVGTGQRDQPGDRRGGGAAGGQRARSEGGGGDPPPAGRRRQGLRTCIANATR